MNNGIGLACALIFWDNARLYQRRFAYNDSSTAAAAAAADAGKQME